MTQSVKIWFDKNFLQVKGAGEILTNLEKLKVQSIIEDLPVSNGIFWTRSDTTIGKDKQVGRIFHSFPILKKILLI